MLEQMEGQVVGIRFTSEETNFTVATLKPDGRYQAIILVGVMPGLAKGMRIRCEGQWDENPKFGRQFRAESYMEVVPATAEGIEAYLASGFIPGIGEKMAQRIVARFGNESLEVIADDPKRLSDIPGLGKKRCEQIAHSFRERRATQEAMVFLYGLGLTPVMAQKIYRRYRDDAVRLVKENPYRLADEIHSIGFGRADKVARAMGIDHTHPLRMSAGCLHALKEATSDGHCFLPRNLLIERAAQLLEVDGRRCQEALTSLVESERLLLVDWPVDPLEPAVYLPTLFEAEEGAAHAVAKLLERQVEDNNALARLSDCAAQLGLDLSDDQQRALKLSLSQGTSIITGGPGTGKTTILRVLLEATSLQRNRISCAAPTGRAAKRLSESTGMEAKTIHRLLEYSPMERKFKRGPDDPLDADLVIIDEASMLDISLFHSLTSAIDPTARLLLVGDVDQLPPVGPGSPFLDLIQSGKVPVARLNQIFRQGRGSEIIRSAHHINQGMVPAPTGAKTPLQDFYFIRRNDPEAVLDAIGALVTERIPKRFGFDPIKEVQILSPMRSGVLGIHNLNRMLQELLNPNAQGLDIGDTTFRVGDKVMQIRNDYDRNVFNGDWGIVTRVLTKDRQLIVEIDGQRVLYERNQFDDLVLAYAISVHKSQGSEYPVVVMPVMTQHFKMLKRNLLYTGLTRGRKLVVLVGTERAMEIAVSRCDDVHRNSMLVTHLNNAIMGGP
jgi:exodeoxyribonuclease V alpha subunit